jgi:hypothetical protein
MPLHGRIVGVGFAVQVAHSMADLSPECYMGIAGGDVKQWVIRHTFCQRGRDQHRMTWSEGDVLCLSVILADGQNGRTLNGFMQQGRA